MTKLVAAMDASGDPNTSRYRFLGIVIGTQDKINAIIKHSGYKGGHLRMVKSRTARNAIISNMAFDGNESIAFCMRVDRGEILEELIAANAKRGKKSKKKIYAVCNRAIAHHIRQAT